MSLQRLVLWLCCLNLGAALWWLSPRPPPLPALPAVEAGVPRLVLRREAPARPRPPPAVVATSCLSLGPFIEAAQLRQAMATLTPKVARIQFREMPGATLRGYRVYLPAGGGREQAMQTARRLAANNIRDYYVVTAGSQRDTISLGVFRDLGNAETRRDELAALGFAVVLEPRTEDGVQWWIDLAAPADFDWRPLLPGAEALQATPVDCR